MSAVQRSARVTGRPRLCGRPAPAVRRLALTALLAVAVAAPATARGDAGTTAAAPAAATAQNVSLTIQLLWQVQQGCAIRCTGSSQTQTAAQKATTLQVAAASVTGDGAPAGSTAIASNTNATIQLIVQTQLGCVAFCLGTTRVQAASQTTSATQLASALSNAVASATNASYVTQLVFQYQDACLQECVDVSERQVVEQAADAVADASGDASSLLPQPPLPPELQSFTVWLATVAAAATVDVVQQRDVADCLHDCAGDVQVQISMQETSTAQVSVAALDIPTATATAPISDSPAPGDGAPAAAAATAAPTWTAPARTTPARRAAQPRRTGRLHARAERRRARHLPVARRCRFILFHRLQQQRPMIGGIHCGT
jgi:hypothetical protein